MAKMTLQNKFVAALTKEGYQLVNNPRTSKFIVFKRTENTFFYVGRAGALRFGKTMSDSIPVSDKHKTFLLSRLEAITVRVFEALGLLKFDEAPKKRCLLCKQSFNENEY